MSKKSIDGNISSEELIDFNIIKKDLEEASLAIDALKLWVDKAELNK